MIYRQKKIVVNNYKLDKNNDRGGKGVVSGCRNYRYSYLKRKVSTGPNHNDLRTIKTNELLQCTGCKGSYREYVENGVIKACCGVGQIYNKKMKSCSVGCTWHNDPKVLHFKDKTCNVQSGQGASCSGFARCSGELVRLGCQLEKGRCPSRPSLGSTCIDVSTNANIMSFLANKRAAKLYRKRRQEMDVDAYLKIIGQMKRYFPKKYRSKGPGSPAMRLYYALAMGMASKSCSADLQVQANSDSYAARKREAALSGKLHQYRVDKPCLKKDRCCIDFKKGLNPKSYLLSMSAHQDPILIRKVRMGSLLQKFRFEKATSVFDMYAGKERKGGLYRYLESVDMCGGKDGFEYGNEKLKTRPRPIKVPPVDPSQRGEV